MIVSKLMKEFYFFHFIMNINCKDFLIKIDISTDIKISLESTWYQIENKINVITHG